MCGSKKIKVSNNIKVSHLVPAAQSVHLVRKTSKLQVGVGWNW